MKSSFSIQSLILHRFPLTTAYKYKLIFECFIKKKSPTYIFIKNSRLTKYQLLLEGILKTVTEDQSEDDPESEEDIAQLRRALNTAKDVLHSVDTAIRTAENEHRLVVKVENVLSCVLFLFFNIKLAKKAEWSQSYSHFSLWICSCCETNI